jgi:hypothetical protein
VPKASEIQAMREARRQSNEHPTPYEDALLKFWDLAVALRKKDGVPPPGKLEGLWIRKLDEQWLMKCNGHAEKIDGVPPFSFYIEFNGWPAGIIDAQGSTFAAGQLANFLTFVSVLEAAFHDTAPTA